MNGLNEKELLARELRERAGDVTGSPLDLDTVRHRARRIQRRRRVVTGAVAAAVAAVALPTGVAVTTALNSPEDPVNGPQFATSPSATPTPGPSDAPTPRADGTFPLTLQGLSRGPEPQVPYVDALDRSVVVPGGVLSTEVAYQQAIRYAHGWLAQGYRGEGSQMFMLDEAMNAEKAFRSGGSFSVSSDGSRVAYVEIQRDGSQYLVSAPTDGSDVQAWPFPERPALEPVGYVDSGTVLYQTTDSQGRTGVGLISAEDRTPLGGFTSVSDANAETGLVLGQTRSDLVDGSCYGVMDPEVSTTSMVWETCDYSLLGFSPDGRFVAASIPDHDGLGAPTLAVLDADTHEVVVEFAAGRNDQTVLFQSTWEDPDTILGIVTDGTTYMIERFELDGSTELAAGPIEVDRAFGDIPVWFGAQAW